MMRRLGLCARVGLVSLAAPSAIRCLHHTPLWMANAGNAPGDAAPGSASSTGTSSSSAAANTSPATSAPAAHANTTAIPSGPYRRVGNVFIVHCVDHPFKFSWEVNRMLRELRLEYMGQTSILPDLPDVRKRLWRVRHVVRIDMLDLDEAKALVGVPEHVSFTDLAGQIPATFGRGRSASSPVIRSKMNFMRLRRMRMRDVLQRDQLEKKLLEEKRKVLKAQSKPANAAAPAAAAK